MATPAPHMALIERLVNQNILLNPGSLHRAKSAYKLPNSGFCASPSYEEIQTKADFAHARDVFSEEPHLKPDITQLEYLANAGVPEAIVLLAKFYYYGKYVPADKHRAFHLLYILVSDFQGYSGVEKHAVLECFLDKAFIDDVLKEQESSVISTTASRKAWLWLNTARLNFIRITNVSKAGFMVGVSNHIASGAFGIYILRMVMDFGTGIKNLVNSREKLKAMFPNHESFYIAKRFAFFIRRFMSKGDRTWRFANDIVWTGFGAWGFVGFLHGTSSALKFVVPLIVGYAFDCAFEIYKLIVRIKRLNKELNYLSNLRDQHLVRIDAYKENIHQLQAKEKRLNLRLNTITKQAGESYKDFLLRKKGLESQLAQVQGNIKTLETYIEQEQYHQCRFERRIQKLNDEKVSVKKNSAFTITTTGLLLVGMAVAKLLTLLGVLSLGPIGLGLVLGVSLIMLTVQMVKSYRESRKRSPKNLVFEAKKCFEYLDDVRKEGRLDSDLLFFDEDDDIQLQDMALQDDDALDSGTSSKRDRSSSGEMALMVDADSRRKEQAKPATQSDRELAAVISLPTFFRPRGSCAKESQHQAQVGSEEPIPVCYHVST